MLFGVKPALDKPHAELHEHSVLSFREENPSADFKAKVSS